MPKATHADTPSRRRFLGAAALLATGAATAAEAAPHNGILNPDAELIRACAEHIINLRAVNEAPDSCEVDWKAEEDELWQAYDTTREVITTAQPQTIEGMVALARVAMAEAGPTMQEAEDRSFHSTEEHLSWNLVRDMLRLYGAAGRA